MKNSIKYRKPPYNCGAVIHSKREYWINAGNKSFPAFLLNEKICLTKIK